jgi:hypothetical protein
VFTCAVCKENIGPRIKPVHVVQGTRPAEYHNVYKVEDEWGNLIEKSVDSIGTEIVGEALVCPDDAKEHYNIEVITYGGTQESKGNGFQEKLVSRFRTPMITNIVYNALERVGHASKRATADSMVAVPGIKAFVDLNPKFIL